MSEKEKLGEKVISEVEGFKLITFAEKPKSGKGGAAKEEYKKIIEAVKRANQKDGTTYFEIEAPKGKSIKNSTATFKKYAPNNWKVGRRGERIYFDLEAKK